MHIINQEIHHWFLFGRMKVVVSMFLTRMERGRFQNNSRYIVITSSYFFVINLLAAIFSIVTSISDHIDGVLFCVWSFTYDYNQLVLELLDDGRLATSDDPPIIFGCLNEDFIQQVWYFLSNLLILELILWVSIRIPKEMYQV